MSRVEQEFSEKFQRIQDRNYAGQAKWLLNGFWDKLEAQAEDVWNIVQLAASLDKRKQNGNELDEFESHQFLEKLGGALTVVEMREKLRNIDIDFNKKMSLTEFFIFKFGLSVKEMVTAPQGGENKEELKEAERLVASAQASLEEVNAQLAAQEAALDAQKKAEDAAKAAAESAAAAAAAAAAAEEEQRKALLELKNQEDDLAKKMSELEIKSQEGGIVSRGKAKQELEQLKAADPLPLRSAKINQEATVRKSEKARKHAEEEAAKAKAAADAAADATRQVEAVKRQVEAAVADANKKLDEALEALEAAKQKPGQSFGDIWWMTRELKEKQKYLPKSKQIAL